MITAFDFQLFPTWIEVRLQRRPGTRSDANPLLALRPPNLSATHWMVAIAAASILLCARPAMARVKLITLPVRERVEIQLDNPGATLVEEERIVPLVKGENQVDFSWANTQIDPNTIVFRVVGPAAGAALDVKVLSVSYPPNEAALVWTVGASESGSARVRISYLLGNLTKSFNYRAVASHDEKTLDLSQYMRLQNLANEEFGDTGLWAGFGPHFEKPIGLNETKEMLVEKYETVPIQKTYTCNPAEFDYLDRAAEQAPRADALRAEERRGPPAGQAAAAVRQGAHLHRRRRRERAGIHRVPRRRLGQVHAEGRRDAALPRRGPGHRRQAHDRQERIRSASPATCFDHDVVVKYEIENFKNSR